MAEVVHDRLVEGLVGARRFQALAHAAAEIDLDRVKAPRRERVDVLLVVPVAALRGSAAAFGARVGVEADLQAGGVQCARQPPHSVRPLRGADRDLTGRVARSRPPADVEPHVAIAPAREAAREQLAGLCEHGRLVVVHPEGEVGVPAHVGGRREHARGRGPAAGDACTPSGPRVSVRSQGANREPMVGAERPSRSTRQARVGRSARILLATWVGPLTACARRRPCAPRSSRVP